MFILRILVLLVGAFASVTEREADSEGENLDEMKKKMLNF